MTLLQFFLGRLSGSPPVLPAPAQPASVQQQPAQNKAIDLPRQVNHRPPVPPLRLTMLTQFYPPDFAATGQFVEELAHNLSTQGMEIKVFTGMPGYAYSDGDAPRQEHRLGVAVQRSRVSRWGDRHFLGRMLRGVLFCLRAALYLCRACNRGDLLLFVSEPPYLQTLGYFIQRCFGLPYACLVYDLYPEVAIELGVMGESHWIVRFWNRVNRAVWQGASVIIVPSETMQERIVQRVANVAPKIAVIHNWADSSWIKPLAKADNDFARHHGLVEPFTVLYSGNMGRCHDIDSILDAAQVLAQEPIRFVFIGGGPKRAACQARVESLGLKNCTFLPYQERSLLPQSLTACDLALVSVARGMEGLVAPSKFYSALASGRPVAVICEPHSYLRQMVADAHCGAAFSNGDGAGLAAFIRHLNRDRALQEKLGEAGRYYVAKHFMPQMISQQYQLVLQQAVLKNSDLKTAIEHQEFCLFFQPIHTLRSGKIQGFEVLLRWQQSCDKLLMPRDFLPRLEATGWICQLTAWVLASAAQQLRQWQETFPLAPQYVRINLSVKQFFDPALMLHLEQAWFAQGLRGESLGFDITEAALIKDPAAAIAVLLQLRERGIRIYLDSFGSGIASLQSLHQFPLDGLALDRTLIGTITTKHGNRPLIESLIALADNLQLPLHAEGIETAEQLAMLKAWDFQLGQGKYLSPPMEGSLATQLLLDNRSLMAAQPWMDQESEENAIAQLKTPPPEHRAEILIVDDERLMRRVFRRFLEREGYGVIEAEDAQQALDLYGTWRPRMVLLDAVMPGLDGFRCCARLRDLAGPGRQGAGEQALRGETALRIFMITSRDDDASVNAAFGAGADDYLTKPINWAVLRQRLRQVLRPQSPDQGCAPRQAA